MANRLKVTAEKILAAFTEQHGEPSKGQVSLANAIREVLCEDDQAFAAQLNYSVDCVREHVTPAAAAAVAEVTSETQEAVTTKKRPLAARRERKPRKRK